MGYFTKEILLLHLAQAEQSLNKAKNNEYSDNYKQDYQNILFELFEKLKEEVELNITTLTEADIYDKYQKHLDFIFSSLEFLDSSTLNQIPFEIVACLKYAMEEWLEPSVKYIIVTSLINDTKGFSYDPSLAFNDALYADINTRYAGISFPHRLVQINLPRAFSRDYLANVALYHELGHFIDLRFSLINSLTSKLFDDIFNNNFIASELDELKRYFPIPNLTTYINDPKRPRLNSNFVLFQSVRSHFREYFCDLFAAQYIGNALSYYITYLTSDDIKGGPVHPATVNRHSVVSDYLGGKTNIVINLINEVLDKVKTKKLEKRYEEVKPDDFFNLLPSNIDNPKQLHGLYNVAWDIWINHRIKLEASLNKADNLRLYNVINNLIEKSIGNFLTLDKWSQAQKTLSTTPAV